MSEVLTGAQSRRPQSPAPWEVRQIPQDPKPRFAGETLKVGQGTVTGWERLAAEGGAS